MTVIKDQWLFWRDDSPEDLYYEWRLLAPFGEGNKGGHVTQWQDWLRIWILDGAHDRRGGGRSWPVPDGIFGPLTKYWTEYFQGFTMSGQGLLDPSDVGRVTSTTFDKMIEELGVH